MDAPQNSIHIFDINLFSNVLPKILDDFHDNAIGHYSFMDRN